LSYKDDHVYKELSSRLTQEEVNVVVLDSEILILKKKRSDTTKSILDLKYRMSQMASASPKISEHALLRYLERVKGMDIQAFKDEILTDKLKRIIQTLGDCKVPLGDGNTAIVRNYVIVTVTAKKI